MNFPSDAQPDPKQVRERYIAVLSRLERDHLLNKLGAGIGEAVRKVLDEEVGQQNGVQAIPDAELAAEVKRRWGLKLVGKLQNGFQTFVVDQQAEQHAEPSPTPQADEKAVAEKLVAQLEDMARRVRIASNRPGREGDLLVLRTIYDCIARLRGDDKRPELPPVLMPMLPTAAYKRHHANIDPDTGKHRQIEVSFFTIAQLRQYAAECVEAAIGKAISQGIVIRPVEPDFGDQPKA
jgi:hypothetical protein